MLTDRSGRAEIEFHTQVELVGCCGIRLVIWNLKRAIQNSSTQNYDACHEMIHKKCFHSSFVTRHARQKSTFMCLLTRQQ